MSGGVATALEEAMEGKADMADVVQAGLFDDLDETDTGSTSAPSPLSAALPAVAKRGRPKGAKGKRTEAVTAWLLSQHRHPVSVIMEAYSMSPIQLAERLGLRRETVTLTTTTTRIEDGKPVETVEEREVVGDHFSNDVLLDLFKLQQRMAEAAAPYVAQRLPQAVELGGGANLMLSIGGVQIGGGSGVSDPARGAAAEFPAGDGMSVRLGQVGQAKSDG